MQIQENPESRIESEQRKIWFAVFKCIRRRQRFGRFRMLILLFDELLVLQALSPLLRGGGRLMDFFFITRALSMRPGEIMHQIPKTHDSL